MLLGLLTALFPAVSRRPLSSSRTQQQQQQQQHGLARVHHRGLCSISGLTSSLAYARARRFLPVISANTKSSLPESIGSWRRRRRRCHIKMSPPWKIRPKRDNHGFDMSPLFKYCRLHKKSPRYRIAPKSLSPADNLPVKSVQLGRPPPGGADFCR